MPKTQYASYQPMRIQARQGSKAEKLYYVNSALPSGRWLRPKAIAPGIDPSPMDDLMYHGGKVVAQMQFQNVYLGGADSWKESDITSIDLAITTAMQDRRMNNMLAQYFPGARVSCDARESFVLDEAPPSKVGEEDVQSAVTGLFDSGLIKKTSLDSTVFNLILPPGAVLALGSSNSLNGLGGYHGSLHIQRGGKKITLYYSANVYSQKLPNGKDNGIPVFDRPWKNVVGTLYHEINEFRTDADVNDAIESGSNDFLGWNSRHGHEIGDQPIFAANDLRQVFKEVAAAKGGRKFPVQFLYSNAVHGAEGPIAKPHS